MADQIELPGDFRGRQTPERQRERRDAFKRFAAQLQALQWTVDFKMSARGWAYILEQHGLTKDQFDLAEGRINTARKEGYLPLDFTASDEARGPQGSDGTGCDYPVEEELDFIWRAHLQGSIESYAPVRWIDYQPYYIEVGVEKVDLVGLFLPVAREFRTMVSNFKGDTDINSKSGLLLRFQEARERGQTPVLLLCGDHDPKGLAISAYMRKQFHDLVGAWFEDGTYLTLAPEDIVIERFGLNFDFIQKHGLSTIPNLITGAGHDLADPKHPDHRKPYVQDYLAQFGAWKCEANSLVTQIDLGRQLLRDTLAKYVSAAGIQSYEEDVAAAREELRKAMPEFLRGKLAEQGVAE